MWKLGDEGDSPRSPCPMAPESIREQPRLFGSVWLCGQKPGGSVACWRTNPSFFEEPRDPNQS